MTSHVDLFFKAWADGHNNRGLSGNRLVRYCDAYADINDGRTHRIPLPEFYLRWESGRYECTVDGHWDSVRNKTKREKTRNGSE